MELIYGYVHENRSKIIKYFEVNLNIKIELQGKEIVPTINLKKGELEKSF